MDVRPPASPPSSAQPASPDTGRLAGPRRFGIATRLWGAFLAVALLSAVIALLAYQSSRDATRTLQTITQDRLPTLLTIARLAEQSSLLLTTLPNLVLLGDEQSLNQRWEDVARAETGLNDAMRAVADLAVSEAWLNGFSDLSGRISATLQLTLSALQAGHEARGVLAHQAGRISILQQEFRLLLDTASAGDPELSHFLISANQIMSLANEILISQSPQEINALSGRARQTLETLTRRLAETEARAQTDGTTASGLPLDALRSFRDRLATLIRGSDALAANRLMDLKATRVANEELDQVRLLSEQFISRVQGILAEVYASIRADRAAAETRLRLSRLLIGLTSAVGVLVALLVAWLYVGRAIVGRINRLSASMNDISAGRLETAVPLGGNDELTDMARALTVFRDAMARLEYLASNDSLTNLRNRRGFHAAATRLLEQRGRQAFLYRINLRRFRDINQMFGYHTGDTILAEIAHRLQGLIRGEDIAARLGGDDFALLTVDDLEPEAAWQTCDDILDCLAQPIVVGHISVDLHPCIGFAAWPEDARDIVALERCAELAAQRAKDEPGKPVRRFASTMATDMEAHALVRQDLRAGIECGDLHLVYQPKVALDSGRIVGMEALVRWTHPRDGLISPIRFIPVAESSGLIIPLGEWVLRECCRQMSVWRRQGLTNLRVSCNMSPIQVLSQDVATLVAAILVETDLPPDCLEIEITEGVFVHDEQRAQHQLAVLRDLGVALSIDDFGTGYSALSYLKRLPATTLKIDQSFIKELTTKPENARLCRAIIGVGHDFGLDVVAEGIETVDHLTFLRSEGCDFGQGYYFSKPLSPDDFEHLARTQPWIHRESP